MRHQCLSDALSYGGLPHRQRQPRLDHGLDRVVELREEVQPREGFHGVHAGEVCGKLGARRLGVGQQEGKSLDTHRVEYDFVEILGHPYVVRADGGDLVAG